MDSVTRGTLTFFFVIIFSTFLWGVFVAYRIGRVGQRYAKHRKAQIQAQYIDLEQAFDSSISSVKSDTLAPSFSLKASNTPSISSLTSLHSRARSCIVPNPTPSESLSTVMVPHAPSARKENRVLSQRKRPWWVRPEEDFSDFEESFGEETEEYMHSDDKVASPRELTVSANGNAAIDREALQADMEKTATQHPTAPKHSTLSKWVRHRLPSPVSYLAYKPSSLRHCLSLESDVPCPPDTSSKSPSGILESTDHECQQSHAPAWMDPREFIAYGSPLRDSQILSPFSKRAAECEEPFKQCMQDSDANSASGVPVSYAAVAVYSKAEERDSYFLQGELSHGSDMQALKRPLSMLYADFRTKNRMQADRIPRAYTDSCLLRGL